MSHQTAQNFDMFSGDDKVLVVTVKDLAGVAVNLTGASITWKLADSLTGTVRATKTTAAGIAITDAADGVFEVTVADADTATLSGSYYHEAEVTDSSGRDSTVVFGNITIRPTLI